MATYPGGIPALTNPVAGDQLNSPPHATQHANANDEIEAICTTLGINPQDTHSTVADRLDAIEASFTFAGMTDTPNSYTAQGGYVVHVKATVDGLEFREMLDEDDLVSDSDTNTATQQSIKAYVDAQIVSQNEFTELIDTPASYATHALKFVRVNVTPDALEFVTPSYALITAGDPATDITAAQLEELSDGTVTTLHDHNHDTLNNYDANDHVDHTTVTLTAGAGLTGGGTIAANRTFTVGAGTGITVNASDIAVSADYSVISANDGATDVTAAELETLSDGSNADLLHVHASITDDRVKVDAAATADYIGATAADGVLRSGASISFTDGGNFVTLNVVPGSVDHDQLLNFAANEHYLQTAITNVSTALATGILTVTTGTGALGVTTNNAANWDTAYSHATTTHDYAYITGNDGATNVTAGELETLTDGSNADLLHVHAGLADEKVAIDVAATAGYLGAASNDGVLRTTTGLDYTDGGDFVTIKLADTAVTPGSYTQANITVDQQGRLTAAASGAGAATTLDSAYDGGGAGAGRTITVDSGAVELTVPDASNNVGLIITQNDTTNNPNAVTITNAGTGAGIELTQSGSAYGIQVSHSGAASGGGAGILINMLGASDTYGLYVQQGASPQATSKPLVYIVSDQVNTNADSALMKLVQSSASASEPALEIANAGTGAALEISSHLGDGIQIQNGAAVLSAGKHLGYFYSNQSNIAADAALVKITQDGGDSTEPALEIANDGTGAAIEITQAAGNGTGIQLANNGSGSGVFITQNFPLATAKNSLTVYSPEAINQTNSDAALVKFIQFEADTTEPCLEIANAGTGAGIEINQSGAGRGIHISQNANNYGLAILNAGSFDSIYAAHNTTVLGAGHHGLYISSNTADIAADAALVKFNQSNASATEPALEIANAGTGAGIEVAQNGNGIASYTNNAGTNHGIVIDQVGVLGGGKHGLYAYSNTAHITADSSLVKIHQDHASSTEPALEITNDGTGSAVEIYQNGSSSGTSSLKIDSSASGGYGYGLDVITSTHGASGGVRVTKTAAGNASHAFYAYNNIVTTIADSALVKLYEDNAGTSEPVVEIINDGTGAGVEITQTGNGKGMYLYNAGTNHALEIQQGGVQGVSQFGMYLYSGTAQTTSPLAFIYHQHASSTQPALYILNAGSGPGIFLAGAGNSILVQEKAAATADFGGYGQLWVKNDTPNTLYFTDDAGTDFLIGGTGAGVTTYDSGWFAVAVSSSYVKTHSLGTQKFLYSVYYSTDSAGVNQEACDANYAGFNTGMFLNTLTTTQCTIFTHSTFVHWGQAQHGSGYCRIILTAV